MDNGQMTNDKPIFKGVFMAKISPEAEQKLRQGFKYLNQFMMLMWRLGLGAWLNAWPDVGGRIMVLVHTGRKTGLTRYTPVNYVIIDDAVYCTAGFGRVAHWYRNVKANPEVEIWLPDGWWAGVAEDISDSKERLPILRQVLIASGFAARSVGINPLAMTDEALDADTDTYRLLRIQRTSPCTGPGGPGDLAWIWPLIALILLPMVLFRRKK